MDLSVTLQDEVALVSVAGQIDSHAAGSLYDTLARIVSEGHAKLAIDLSDVDGITRAGMRGIIVAARLMRTRRGVLRIRNASDEVETLLKNFGFADAVCRDGVLDGAFLRAPDRAGTMLCPKHDNASGPDDRILRFPAPANARARA